MGLPPEIVKQAAEKEGVEVEVPENFYALIANRHMQAPKPVEEEEAKAEKTLEKVAEQLPATEQLYYADVYQKEFDAKVLKIINGIYVVLDRTCFYPEGGGQPTDQGWLISGNAKFEVVDVQKIGKVIVHKLKHSSNIQGRQHRSRHPRLGQTILTHESPHSNPPHKRSRKTSFRRTCLAIRHPERLRNLTPRHFPLPKTNPRRNPQNRNLSKPSHRRQHES